MFLYRPLLQLVSYLVWKTDFYEKVPIATGWIYLLEWNVGHWVIWSFHALSSAQINIKKNHF
jgi:hypothetical protein